jgi:hypothetical protein
VGKYILNVNKAVLEMLKVKKTILVLLITASTLLSIGSIVCGIILNVYSDNRLDSNLMNINANMGKTEFYYYENFADHYGRR